MSDRVKRGLLAEDDVHRTSPARYRGHTQNVNTLNSLCERLGGDRSKTIAAIMVERSCQLQAVCPEQPVSSVVISLVVVNSLFVFRFREGIQCIAKVDTVSTLEFLPEA